MPLPNYKESRTKAIQQYDAAWHLLNVTLPLTNDPHLLIGILHNISESLEHALDSIISYEQQLKNIPLCEDTFESKFNLFRMKVLHKNNIPSEIPRLILDLRETIKLQRSCPTEFQRGNRLVLATKDYQMKSVDLPQIKTYLEQCKQFLKIIDQITGKAQQKDLNPARYS